MNKLFLDVNKRDIKNKVLVAGFHGIGSVGWITVNFLCDKLKGRRIGIIVTDNIPLFAARKEDFIVTPYELYLAENFLFLKCNMPVSSEEAYSVLKYVIDLVNEEAIKEAFLIGGLDSRLKKENDEKIRYICTPSLHQNLNDKIVKNKRLTKLEKGLYVVGPLALLLIYFEALKVPTLTILPYAKIDRPDPEAASEAVKIFSYIYDRKIDYLDLIEQAKEVERYLNEIQKKLEEMRKEESKLIYI